jgi:hypothetical protein
MIEHRKALGGYSYKEQLLDISPLLFMAISMYTTVLLAGRWLQQMEMAVLFVLLIQIAVGAVIYLLLSAIIKPYSYCRLLEAATAFLKKEQR